MCGYRNPLQGAPLPSPRSSPPPNWVNSLHPQDMKLKPSILAEYTKERTLQPLLGNTKFVQDGGEGSTRRCLASGGYHSERPHPPDRPTDSMVMEDEGARMMLKGEGLDIGRFSTGMVVAVRGRDEGKGEFHVTAVCLPGLPAQSPPPKLDEDQYVALISGLTCGSGAEDEGPAAERRALLAECLSGACLGH